MRENVSTYTRSENNVGYSRAVIVNNIAYVSGTTAINQNGEIIDHTLYKQAIYIFHKIEDALTTEGFVRNELVLVRAYITDMQMLNEFDKAFKEFCGDIHPACTLVGITALVDKKLFIEIECIYEKDIASASYTKNL